MKRLKRFKTLILNVVEVEKKYSSTKVTLNLIGCIEYLSDGILLHIK